MSMTPTHRDALDDTRLIRLDRIEGDKAHVTVLWDDAKDGRLLFGGRTVLPVRLFAPESSWREETSRWYGFVPLRG